MKITKMTWILDVYLVIPVVSLVSIAAVNIMTDDLVILFAMASLIYLLGYIASAAITKAAGKPVKNVKYNLVFVIIKAAIFALALVSLTTAFITQGSPLVTTREHFWVIDYLVLEVYMVVYLVGWAIMTLFAWSVTRRK